MLLHVLNLWEYVKLTTKGCVASIVLARAGVRWEPATGCRVNVACGAVRRGEDNLLSQVAMDMKAILQKSYYAQKLLDTDLDKRKELRSLMEKITPTLSDMPKSYRDPDKLGTALIRLEELDSTIATDIKELTDLLARNRMLIDSLERYEQRIILTKRYVNFEHWVDIAHEMHYSRRTIIRINQEALECLSKQKKVGTQCHYKSVL